MNRPDTLEKLITIMAEEINSKSLSDEYLKEHGNPTRENVGIGEYQYGIVMIPETWVLPYLEELLERRMG